MNRRTFTRNTAYLGGLAIAGCMERAPGSDDTANTEPTDDDTTDDEPEDDDSVTPPDTIRDTRFSILDRTASEYELGAAVGFDADQVVITGTISGNNSCYSAKLNDLTLDDQLLTADIVSFDDADEDEVCLEVLIGITYELVIDLHGDPPPEVLVVHNDEETTRVHRP